MGDELVFYTNPMSRGRIARWMLEEVGQPYRTEVLDFGDDEGARLSRRQPDGEGAGDPTRRYVVTEAAAICAYLADAFPQAALAPPPGDRLRGPIIAGCSSPPVRSKPRSRPAAAGLLVQEVAGRWGTAPSRT